MERRTLLAVVLSIFIIIAFNYWISKHYPQQHIAKPPLEGVSIPERKEGVAEIPVEEIILDREEEFVTETDRFILTFSNSGGAVKKIGLKEFEDRDTGMPYELVNIKDPRFYVGAFNLTELKSIDTSVYQMSRDGNKIRYLYKAADIEIEKIYTIYNSNDYIDLHIVVKNKSQNEIRTRPRIVVGSDINLSEPMAYRYSNVSAKVDGRLFRDKRETIRSGDTSWVALNSKYFCIILRPFQLGAQAFTNKTEKGDLSGGIGGTPLVIAPGREITQQYLFYVGPLDLDRLGELGFGIEEAVDYGVFSAISRILLSTLRFFHKIFRNWGVAIICLTLLVNIILYPLTKKSHKSMKAMQELQPHIDTLRTVHKDNSHKLNKELMELYRKYKVNPLGGCLPLLLQMPIFIALYHALIRSIELKGANFLWIKDLSKPDAVRLPISLPVIGKSINILPILMMIAMIIQQKISSPHRTTGMSEQQRQQQAMMLMMPVIFVIIFYTLPSGLVLYWLVNTVLMSAHHYWLLKRAPIPVSVS